MAEIVGDMAPQRRGTASASWRFMSDERTQKSPTHRLALRCPREVYAAIVAASEREHRTISNMVVELARRGLERTNHEHLPDARDARKGQS